jgi:hypothetical protein
MDVEFSHSLACFVTHRSRCAHFLLDHHLLNTFKGIYGDK